MKKIQKSEPEFERYRDRHRVLFERMNVDPFVFPLIGDFYELFFFVSIYASFDFFLSKNSFLTPAKERKNQFFFVFFFISFFIFKYFSVWRK